ncbi:MAG: DMT family transporter [Bacteroidia bacterium]|nr:DMT family transporter [Bacteroidota bacterium]MBP9083872.1 DMT family transporter [Bacteroidia bacterium]MBK7387726.1 DMT family transporter [Bacteroidota bacterium]MBK7971211.1 DMT family transporter [Bacteroidota bacterium]MBK8416300.1 DMT family transporter [Bacteroidota bacterium]
MIKSVTRQAHLAVLTANLIYGANYSIAKKVMPEFIDAFGFIFIRVTVTAAIFIVLGFFSKGKSIEKQDFLRLFFCAVFGVALNQLLFFKGLDLTSPINASLMMTTNPIMVLLAASLLIREKITIRKITGIMIGIAGASLLLIWGKEIMTGGTTTVGDLLVLINSLSFGIFLIIVKPLMQKYDTITVMKWVFLFGTVLVTPFGWNEYRAIQWHTFSSETWWALAYVVIATTSIAYILNTYALKALSPSSVSIYIYLQPLFAAFFAIALGKDHLQIIHFIAAILIFTGVYLVTSVNRKENNNGLLSLKKS